MSVEKKVSIITVSYNAVNTIEQTICSVLKQSYKNIEYIIIDGQSTDGTFDIVNKYAERIDYFVSEPDTGIYDAMNKGIQQATGDIIGIINSDDWYEPDTVEKIVSSFESTNAELIYGNVCYISEDGEKSLKGEELSDKIWYSMVTPHPSVFVLSKVYERYGYFNTKYKIAADYELILRFYTEGVRFLYLDQVLANFRSGGISTIEAEECAEEGKTIMLSYVEKFTGDKKAMIKQIQKRYNIERFVSVINRTPDLLLDYLKKVFPNFNNEIIIWGTGIWGKRCYDLLEQCNVNIVTYIDNNEEKWGSKVKGTVVKGPQELRSGKGNILIAVRYFDNEIVRQLNDYNNHCLKWVTIEDMIEKVFE